MMQDEDDSDWEISKNQSEDPGESILSSDIEEDKLLDQQEVLHLDQVRHDLTV